MFLLEKNKNICPKTFSIFFLPATKSTVMRVKPFARIRASNTHVFRKSGNVCGGDRSQFSHTCSSLTNTQRILYWIKNRKKKKIVPKKERQRGRERDRERQKNRKRKLSINIVKNSNSRFFGGKNYKYRQFLFSKF